MPRMKRKDVLTAIRAAGYHGDLERATLLYVKNWVSLEAFSREFDLGSTMRQSGMPCECSECRKGETDSAYREIGPLGTDGMLKKERRSARFKNGPRNLPYQAGRSHTAASNVCEQS